MTEPDSMMLAQTQPTGLTGVSTGVGAIELFWTVSGFSEERGAR